MAVRPGKPDRADLQARWNVLSVRRDELARRFPGSFQLSNGPNLGARAPPGLLLEWEHLASELARLEADLQGAP